MLMSLMKPGTASVPTETLPISADQTVDPERAPVPNVLLFTTLLNPDEVNAVDLAAAYAQRWEIEPTFDELKTHQRGPRTVLRSKSPDLVLQEIWGTCAATSRSAP